MSSAPDQLIGERLRSPRVAAYAGIVFAVLAGTSMSLVHASIPLDEPYDPDWLENRNREVGVAVALIPFAGIAFLWFVGVLRDQLGAMEDRLFSTVFVGSGLLFLAGLFLWMSLIGAVLASADVGPTTWPESESFVFASSLIKIMGGVVTLRMAGVFMFASGTIWRRTGVMPRWAVWVTYGSSLSLLIAGPTVRIFRLGFPLWVVVVSVLLLRRQRRSPDADDPLVATE